MMTFKEAKQIVNSLNLTITKRPATGEYRVDFRGTGKSDTAYFTDDLDDAVATARDMAKRLHAPIISIPPKQGMNTMMMDAPETASAMIDRLLLRKQWAFTFDRNQIMMIQKEILDLKQRIADLECKAK